MIARPGGTDKPELGVWVLCTMLSLGSVQAFILPRETLPGTTLLGWSWLIFSPRTTMFGLEETA